MSIAIYGEIGIDILMSHNNVISKRIGGAGLYAAIAAAKQNKCVDLLTIYGNEIDPIYIKLWEEMKVFFKNAKKINEYSIPKYISKGYEKFGKKNSIPLTEIKLNLSYEPVLDNNCELLVVFPINHSLPINLINSAKQLNIPIILDPKPNENSIEDIYNILNCIDVLLVNEEELVKIAKKQTIEDNINYLKTQGVNIIVLKHGANGCSIYTSDKFYRLEAYVSDPVCTLGSGDVFAGVFASGYVSQNAPITEIVDTAQCIVADFIEKYDVENILPYTALDYEKKTRKKQKIHTMNKNVYLAGPFFSEQQKDWELKVYNTLFNAGFSVYSPSKENGILSNASDEKKRKDVFEKDICAIDSADFIVALLDNNDAGTNFEIGYAYSKKKRVLGLYTNTIPLNNMITMGCDKILMSIDDLLGELYDTPSTK